MSSKHYLLGAGILALALPGAASAAPWLPLAIHTRSDLTTIDFSDPTHGIIGGVSGALYRTDDGVQWEELVSPLSESLHVARRLSPEVMLIARNSLRRSIDGGKNWDAVPSIPDGVAMFDILKAGNGQLFMLRSFDVWVSGDAGASWQMTYDGADDQPFTHRLREAAADTYVAFGGRSYDGFSAAHVLRTIDGGQSWQFSTPPIAQILGADFAAAANGIVATLDGALWRTTDAGASFDPIDSDLPAGLVINEIRAWQGRWYAATSDGNLFSSLDDGLHWKPEYNDGSGNAINALDVRFVPIAVGAAGTGIGDDGIFGSPFEDAKPGK